MHKIWHDTAWEDCLYWQTQDRNNSVRISLYGFLTNFRKQLYLCSRIINTLSNMDIKVKDEY